MFDFLSDNIKENIKLWAINKAPNETGGFILNSGVIQCDNISPNPESHYLMRADILDHLGISTRDILAFWHSHTNDFEGFSQPDIIIAEKLNINSLVYNIKSNLFHEYKPIGYEIPYIGRQWYFRILDCLTLAIDYYKRELNIEFDYIEHPSLEEYKSWRDYPDSPETRDVILKYMADQGFRRVEDLKKHDILVIKPDEAKIPCHFGVYLGNNEFLHQLSNLSNISAYGRYWKARTRFIFRHSKML